MHSVLSWRQQHVEWLSVPAAWCFAMGDRVRRRVGACGVFGQDACTHLLVVPLSFSINAGLRTFVVYWSDAWAAGWSVSLRLKPPRHEPARGRAHALRYPRITAVLSGGGLLRNSCDSGPHCCDSCPRVLRWLNFACERPTSVVVDCASVGSFSPRHDVCTGRTRACSILVCW